LRDRDTVIAPDSGAVDPGALARLAVERWQAGMRTDRLEPRYLHAPDVTMPKGTAP
jgi:hypothetical protein